MSELVTLPKGWVKTNVGNISKVIHYGYTATATKNDTGTQYLRITDIQDNAVDWINVPFCDIPKEAKVNFLLKENDIVFARTGGTVGKSFLIKNQVPSAVFASYLIRIILTENTIPEFIYLFFQSADYWQQIELGKTGLKTNVNAQILSSLFFQLPPLNEQKRIVSKIEKLFSELDNVKDTLQKVKLQLVQYRQSLLKSAFEGKLTEEWRENNSYDIKHTKTNNSLPVSWDLIHLIEIAEINPVKPTKNTINDNLEVSFLPMKCVEELTGNYDLSNIRKYGEVKKGYTFFKNGDIIFAKITPCMENGKIAIVNELKNGMGFGSTEFHVIRLKEDKMSRQFYFYYLIQDNFRGIAQRNMKGTAGQLRVSSDYMKNILVPTIPFEEQEQIVIEIEQKFSLIENIEFITNSMLKQLDTLHSSILKQAFEGKLVPQDPNDESAEKLLEQIKEQKQSQQTKAKSRGKK